ncbi:Crp/Fnr family transcriptional regulator [Roseivirga sp. BDSF3-8]|uniref:Crp/Fnr family transcriptional regulator n=1 Tax=Roseivirga sp. BDSF3-8 TaxID=3241598 RepID=UPI003531C901
MDVSFVKDQIEYLFEPELIDEIIEKGEYREFDQGAELMDIGQQITHFPLLLSGSLKIMTEDEEGNELLLYYLEMGDTCAMTLQCCLKENKSKIRAIAEEKTRMILIPVALMEEWIVRYQSWRRFVFDSYNNRLNEMLEAVDNLAFRNLEERLYKYLRDKALINSNAQLRITHHQIAQELNTSRVVISRLMKKLEQQGKITHDRNMVSVSEFA